MNRKHINPSAVCRNPSRLRDEYGRQNGLGSHHNCESVNNVSRRGVTDFGGVKSINTREISLFSINTSHSHARTRVLRPRTCEGCVTFLRDGLDYHRGLGNSIRQRSHTLAHVRNSCDVGPTFPTRHATQHAAPRLRTCDLPLWQANRYLAKKSNEDWPVGTGTNPMTVCSAGPTWQGGV